MAGSYYLDVQGSVSHARGRADGSQCCRQNRYYQLDNRFPKFFVLHYLVKVYVFHQFVFS